MKKNISIILSFFLAFNSLSLAKPNSTTKSLSKKIADHVQMNFMAKKNLKDILQQSTLFSPEFKKEMLQLLKKKKVENQPLPKMSISLVADGVKFIFEKNYELSFKVADRSFRMNGQRIKVEKNITAEELFAKMSDAINPNKSTSSFLNIFVQPAHAMEPVTITVLVIVGFSAIIALGVKLYYDDIDNRFKRSVQDHALDLLRSGFQDLECISDDPEKFIYRPTKFKFRNEDFEITYGENGKVAEVKFSDCVLKGYQDGGLQVQTKECENKVKTFLPGNGDSVFFYQRDEDSVTSGKYFSIQLSNVRSYCINDPDAKIFQVERASFLESKRNYAAQKVKEKQDAEARERQRIEDAKTFVRPQPK